MEWDGDGGGVTGWGQGGQDGADTGWGWGRGPK